MPITSRCTQAFTNAISVAALGLAILGPPAPASPRTPARVMAPQFSKFPARAIYRGKPAAVNLRSHPSARRFRTALIEGARRGPNFAGRFTVVTWGCGTRCQMLGIVDARTGAVFLPKMSLQVGASYRRNSNLLVADPPEEWRRMFGRRAADYPAYARSKYLRWTGRELVPIATVEPWRL